VFDALKRLFRPQPGAGNVPLPTDRLDALERRLASLEESETVRAIQWAETRSALDRMLRRAAALQSRDEANKNGDAKGRDQLIATLRAKGLLRGE
jgi:hypothetical protein